MSAKHPSPAALAGLVVVLQTFLLGIVKIHDTDTWMHLAVGREIYRLGGLPATEPWTYTMAGQPFVYHPWLFALGYYLAYLLGSFAGVALLKASLNGALFYVLFRDAGVPRQALSVSVLALMLPMLAGHNRLVERPEAVMYLLLALTIHLFNLALFEGRQRPLAFLPLIGLVWGNVHTSVNLIAGPCAAFFAGVVADGALARWRGTASIPLGRRELGMASLIMLATVGTSLLNPSGTSTWLAGASLLKGGWHSDEITELQPPVWGQDVWPFALTLLIAGAFLLNRRRASVFHVLLVVPFVALAFTARRFVGLYAVVAAPIIARSVATALAGRRLGAWLDKTLVSYAAVAGFVVVANLTYWNIGPFGNIRQQPGVGINYATTPEAALRYLDASGVSGRLFNQFEWGGYIIWRDTPTRAPFIDGRGALPTDLLEAWQVARSSPVRFSLLHRRFGISAVVLPYPASPGEVDLGRDLCFFNPRWALVYWDDQAVVYLERDGPYRKVVERDAFQFARPCNDVGAVVAGVADPATRPHLIRELRRAALATNASRAWAFLGVALGQAGEAQEAIEALSHVRRTPKYDFRPTRFSALGNVYMELGRVDDAITAYREALRLSPNGTSLYLLAQAFRRKGDDASALGYLEQAARRPDAPLGAVQALADVYRSLGRSAQADRTLSLLREVSRRSEGEAHFQAGLRAYLQNDVGRAVAEFAKSVEVNPSNASAWGNLGFAYFDMGLLSQSYQYHRKALDLDPGQANSYYGLAMILSRWGDAREARRHWREYLDREPRGYYARRAREELTRLPDS